MGKNDIWIYGGGLLLVGGAAAIYMGCDWNIEFLCNIRTQIEEMMQPGGGAGGGEDTGGDTDDEDEDTGSGGKTGKVSLASAMTYYAYKIAEDLDDFNGGDLNRTKKLNIRGYLLQHQKSKLETIAKSVDKDTSQPLSGKAKYLYTEIMLKAANKFNVNIPPAIKARLHDTLEGGYKSYRADGSLFSHMTISVA